MAKKDVVVTLEFTDKGSAKIKKVVKDTEKQLKGLGKSAKDSGKGFKKMGDEVKKSGAGMSKFKSIMKSTAAQMAMGMGAMMGIQGAIRGVKRILSDTMQTGREFEREWANVTTMLTISTEETEKMKWELLKLSPILGETTDLAKGMYQVLSASIQPAKAIKFLGEAAKSAQAGVTTTTVAVDALTTVINAYGYAAEDVTKVSDIMFQTVKRGKLTYEGMSGALGTIVPIASQVGISFEDIAAAMATLTRQGIDVNTTTVQLRQVMVSVLKPTKEAADEAKRLGLEFSAAAIKAKGLGGFLADVQAKTGGSSDSMTKLFGNVRALTGVMGLAGKSAEAFAYDMELMGRASGSTEVAFQKQMQSADFWMKTAKNTIKKLQIAVYEGLVAPFKKGITTSKDLDTSIETLIDKVFNFGAAIGSFAKSAMENISILIAGFSGLQASVNKTAEVFTDRLMKKLDHNYKTQVEVMSAAKVEAKLWAESVEHVAVSLEDLADKFDKVRWREKIEALNRSMEEQAQTQAILEGNYDGLWGAITRSGIAMKENIGFIYATANSSKEASDRVRAYKESINDIGKATEKAASGQEKLNEALKKFGVTLKTNLEVRLKSVTAFFEKYREQLSPNSVIKLAKEIKTLRLELGLQEEVVTTIIPKTVRFADTFRETSNILAQANIETNALSHTIAFMGDSFMGAVEWIKEMKENAIILGVQTIPMLTSSLKKQKETLAELMKEKLLDPKAIVASVEQIIAGMKRLGIPIDKFYKELLKTNKKAASILAKDWMKSFSQVGVLLNVLGEQTGGLFGDLISTVGLGIQQAMELAKDEILSFADILGRLSPMIGEIGGALGSLISGTTENFAKMGASLGGAIGGMFGPLGKAIGSFAGGLLGGLFKKKKDPAQIAAEALERHLKDITNTLSRFGEISEATAEKIQKTDEALEGFAAVSMHFADVIRDVGVRQDNINDLWVRTGEIVQHVKSGFLGLEEGTAALGESFTLLLEGARKLGQEGSQAMLDFIRNVRESGLEVKEVTEYVLDQLDKIPSSLNTLIKNMGNNYKKLGKIVMVTFNAMIANGRGYMETLEAMKGPLEALFDEYEKRGKKLPSYLQPMKDLMEAMELKPKIFENLDAAISVLDALRNTAYLTQGAFDALASTAKKFARAILDVEGNLNQALKSMTLTESQIQQLLPVVAQFVGAAALFGLGIPAWMKTFVTQQLGVDWGDFKETVKAQAGAGIATVEKLQKLIEKTKEGNKRMRDKLHNETTRVIEALRGGRRKDTEPDLGAAQGFHGTVPKPTTILVHPDEQIDITPNGQPQTGGDIIFAPSFNLLDGSDVGSLVEEKLFPAFLRLVDLNKGGARFDLRKAAEIE